jgi:hypothetical protein
MRLLANLFIVAIAVFSAAAQSVQLQPLPIVLPKPLFEGTPARVPNLGSREQAKTLLFCRPERPTWPPQARFLASDSDPVIAA